jgi:hypothetical protein
MLALDNNFLLPDESPQDFAAMASDWTEAFPGSSIIIESLREDLVLADWLRRRARRLLQQLKLDLHSTGLPPFYWDPFVQRHFRFLEKHASQTQNEFRKAFKLISALKPAKAEEPPPAPPPEDKRDYRPVVPRTVRVKVVNGKTVTERDPGPDFLLREEVRARASGLWRTFHFKDGVIPEEYAYVLEHEGVQYEPAHIFLISYRIEDALDICRREIETKSEHLLDGPRWGYDRSDLIYQERRGA